MKCLNCGNEYYAWDEDAGTHKESYCSEECVGEAGRLVDIAMKIVSKN